jgi:adenylate cyclase
MAGMADDDLPPGLVDPGAPDADAQRELVAYLLGRGVAVSDLRAAHAEGAIAHFVADAALWPDSARLSIADLAGRAGLDAQLARRARRMLGLADPGDEARCREREVEYFSAFAAGAALFGEELTLQFARVLGTSAAAIAEAATNLFAGEIAADLAARGATDAELGLTARDAMVAFEAVAVATDVALRLQFELALTRLNGEVAVNELTFAVAFVDVVGSTAMAETLGGGDVAAALRDFDRLAAEAAVHHEVRLVKLIGDGAMLAAREPGPLARAVGELMDHVGEHPVLKAAKAGLTFGPVAAHDGDYFGQVVNLAARASNAALPGEVLVDSGAAAPLADRVEPAGEYDLKGFADPVPLFRLRDHSL